MMVNVAGGSLQNTPHNTELPKFFSRGRGLAARGSAQGVLLKVRQESKQLLGVET